MEKRFDFTKDNIKYENWEKKDYFKCKKNEDVKPFVIVMPPPNVTGILHMGHALNMTTQDILIRYNRLKGVPTLWVPGTDHASIATEAKVVEKLKKEGKEKAKLGREEFLKEAHAWSDKYGSEILNQVRKIGCSCDFDKKRFTMDDVCSKAVLKAFIHLNEKGYIYRGKRLVNWCPNCKTSISDIEIDYQENNGNLWYIKYLIEGTNDYITVATTRPETILGDTALAVNKDDERYTHLINKNVIIPIINKKIKVIADDYVESDFGTGVVKITPAHDFNDFEVGKRHNLEQINILNEDATMNKNAYQYEGMDRYEARKKIVEDLEKIGHLEKIEKYNNNIGSCYRCKTVVEPYLSDQWYVKMSELAKPAIKAAYDDKLKFIPSRFEKNYLHWMENIEDWCISRQLWWGHRIPAYHCTNCSNIDISETKIEKCSKCGGKSVQDEDTLDTWFSSALWPFSVFGWPDKTEDFNYFYPTSVLATGPDIISFWVSKMVFSGLEYTGKIPFETVYLNGIVKDELGRKMSKSLGNGINPLDVIKENGADVLRFSLIYNTSAGNDLRYKKDKVELGTTFVNKIWNATKFVTMYLDDYIENKEKLDFKYEDKWIITRFNNLVSDMNNNMKQFEIGVSLNNLYNYIMQDFCDTYIEMVKYRLYDIKDNTAIYTLNYILKNIVIMLSPYMPFVSEEIYLNLNGIKESIMEENYPIQKYTFKEEAEIVDEFNQIIKKVRNYKSENNIPNKITCDIDIITEYKNIVEGNLGYFKKMLNINNVNYVENSDKNISFVSKTFTVNMEFNIEIDDEKEKLRIKEELKKAEFEKSRAEKMLSNEKFVAKAPQKLIEEEKQKIEKYTKIINELKEMIN